MNTILLAGIAAVLLIGLLYKNREHLDPTLFDPLDTDKNEALSRAEFGAASAEAASDADAPETSTSEDAPEDEPGINTPMEPSTEFEIALDLFKKYMTAYKTTGNEGNKTAADEAKKWIDDYLKGMGDQVETDTAYIRQFVSEYKETNPELIKMQETIRKVKEEGPKLQDTYETEKKAVYVEPYDVQQFYTKAGILGGVAAIIAVVTFF